eukprot:g258.t1
MREKNDESDPLLSWDDPEAKHDSRKVSDSSKEIDSVYYFVGFAILWSLFFIVWCYCLPFLLSFYQSWISAPYIVWASITVFLIYFVLTCIFYQIFLCCKKELRESRRNNILGFFCVAIFAGLLGVSFGIVGGYYFQTWALVLQYGKAKHVDPGKIIVKENAPGLIEFEKGSYIDQAHARAEWKEFSVIGSGTLQSAALGVCAAPIVTPTMLKKKTVVVQYFATDMHEYSLFTDGGCCQQIMDGKTCDVWDFANKLALEENDKKYRPLSAIIRSLPSGERNSFKSTSEAMKYVNMGFNAKKNYISHNTRFYDWVVTDGRKEIFPRSALPPVSSTPTGTLNQNNSTQVIYMQFYENETATSYLTKQKIWAIGVPIFGIVVISVLTVLFYNKCTKK